MKGTSLKKGTFYAHLMLPNEAKKETLAAQTTFKFFYTRTFKEIHCITLACGAS